MQNNNTLFLTGLRGYSALAVFFIHSGGGGFRELGGWASRIVDLGKYGVISFFVLSALTLAMSIERSGRFSYSHYMLRRFARIFPMYSVAMVIFWSLGGNEYYREMFGVPLRETWDLFLHLTFLNLWDARYQASIIGVEWTVPIEMWTYLAIPPLFFLLRRIRSAWRWAVFAGCLALALADVHWHKEWLGAHWAIESYLYCFVGGLIAYGYLDRVNLPQRKADILVAAILLGAVFPPGGGHMLELWFTLLVMALILVLSQAGHMRLIFENRSIVLLGNISFSFYLLHFPVIQYVSRYQFSAQVAFLLALAITAGVAYLCHAGIEKPVLRLSGKLNPYDK